MGIVAGALSTAAIAHGQPVGQITGTILDPTGHPLAGVNVTLEEDVPRAVQTGADGRFTFASLSAGEYDITAKLAGFAPESRAVRLADGETVKLSIALAVQIFEQTLVTAGRTGARDVQSTPMAVTALSSTELQRVQAHTVEQLAGWAPSVTFSQNTGFAQLTIRGIGTNAVFAGSDPSSAIYVDGVYLARPAMALADFLELDRVEVLRGPQGTLYGRNAVGGAINIVTRNPTNEMEASVRGDAGTFKSARVEARVSGPLVPNRLLASGSFLRGYREGFVRDVNHPDDPLGGEDVTAGRGKLQVIFNRRSDLLVSADVTHRDPVPMNYPKVLDVKPGFTVDNPADLHEVRSSMLAEGHNVQFGGSARFTIGLANDLTLTSLTAFRALDYELKVDGDITELELVRSQLHEIQHQISEEVTLAQQRRRLKWIAGLFLLEDNDRQPTFVHLGGPRLVNHLNPEVEAGSRALFGEATFELMPRLSATAGLRYTHERKTIVNEGELFTQDLPVVHVPGSTYAYTDTKSYDAWTPKIAMEVDVASDTLGYVSATRGFKSGGYNFASPEAGRGFAPEFAWSYEAGLKTLVAGGHARLNVAAFHTSYTDLQVSSTFRPGVIDITNAAAATIRGVELETTTELFRALHAGGHLAWLDAKYDEYDAIAAGGVTQDVSGHRLSNAPEWSGRAWLEWNAALGGPYAVSLRADTRWQSTVFFAPFNDTIQRQRSYGLVDVSGELQSRRGGFSAGVYARNLTNADYITGSFSSPPPAIGGRPGEPRQVGFYMTVAR
jgi:iron complex outermembrane receptor protein